MKVTRKLNYVEMNDSAIHDYNNFGRNDHLCVYVCDLMVPSAVNC